MSHQSANDDPLTPQGAYVPAGEDQGEDRLFTAEEMAEAFGVDASRVRSAIEGEFGGDSGTEVTSKQAQDLAEIFLSDHPLADQEAALMTLGAFTPRRDSMEATAEPKPPGEQSDKLRDSQGSVKSTS